MNSNQFSERDIDTLFAETNKPQSTKLLEAGSNKSTSSHGFLSSFIPRYRHSIAIPHSASNIVKITESSNRSRAADNTSVDIDCIIDLVGKENGKIEQVSKNNSAIDFISIGNENLKENSNGLFNSLKRNKRRAKTLSHLSDKNSKAVNLDIQDIDNFIYISSHAITKSKDKEDVIFVPIKGNPTNIESTNDDDTVSVLIGGGTESISTTPKRRVSSRKSSSESNHFDTIPVLSSKNKGKVIKKNSIKKNNEWILNRNGKKIVFYRDNTNRRTLTFPYSSDIDTILMDGGDPKKLDSRRQGVDDFSIMKSTPLALKETIQKTTDIDSLIDSTKEVPVYESVKKLENLGKDGSQIDIDFLMLVAEKSKNGRMDFQSVLRDPKYNTPLYTIPHDLALPGDDIDMSLQNVDKQANLLTPENNLLVNNGILNQFPKRQVSTVSRSSSAQFSSENSPAMSPIYIRKQTFGSHGEFQNIKHSNQPNQPAIPSPQRNVAILKTFTSSDIDDVLSLPLQQSSIKDNKDNVNHIIHRSNGGFSNVISTKSLSRTFQNLMLSPKNESLLGKEAEKEIENEVASRI